MTLDQYAQIGEFIAAIGVIANFNGWLFRCCLDKGLRISQQLILMEAVPAGPPDET